MQNKRIDVRKCPRTAPARKLRVRVLRPCRALALVAALLSACAQQPPAVTADKPPVNLSGYSPAFREGFGDGCETARGRSKKNDARYAEEVQYRRGWDDASAICARR